MKLIKKTRWLWAFLLTAAFYLSCATVQKPTSPRYNCEPTIYAVNKRLAERDKEMLNATSVIYAKHSVIDYTCTGNDTALVNILIELEYLDFISGQGQKSVCSKRELSTRSSLDLENKLSIKIKKTLLLELRFCENKDIKIESRDD
jgi:hypothetical protein